MHASVTAPDDRRNRVCVVGAGSSGLAAARNFLAYGFDVDVLEREADLGGNWNYDRGTARVYRSTHTISSKPGTEYPDFPMPASYPDYPHHTQILQYFRDYAAHFGLLEHIEFNTPVASIVPLEGGPDAGWRVTLGSGEVREYGAVVIANGHNWNPKYPTYPGTFAGTTMHSAFYRTPDVFEGKRVLVVGAGNSGCDIVVEASQHATRAYHSTRRGYHYFPKFVFGKPADQVGDLLHRLRVPLPIRRWIGSLSMRLIVGDYRKTGLPQPDHKLFETHPVANTLLPYYVKHGDIVVKPDVSRFDGHDVHFVDGTSATVDLVVYATGYLIEFPFIDRQWLNWRDGRPVLYQNVFHPSCDTLFVSGLIQPDSGQFGHVHWQMKAAAAFLRAAHNGAPQAAAFRRERVERLSVPLSGGVKYLESTRHYLEVEHWSYRRGLMRIARGLEAGAAHRPAQRSLVHT
ncbi:MAG: NAD(P)-binding domain-containing protein [Gemmatimonadaceae bacterium]|nr:NAD(P)-binding domain-containing protein [Gemmatimonadaceae bacterium]